MRAPAVAGPPRLPHPGARLIEKLLVARPLAKRALRLAPQYTAIRCRSGRHRPAPDASAVPAPDPANAPAAAPSVRRTSRQSGWRRTASRPSHRLSMSARISAWVKAPAAPCSAVRQADKKHRSRHPPFLAQRLTQLGNGHHRTASRRRLQRQGCAVADTAMTQMQCLRAAPGPGMARETPDSRSPRQPGSAAAAASPPGSPASPARSREPAHARRRQP